MASERTPISPSIKITRSTCTFQFEIDYNKSKDLPTGEFISSPTFTAGGYDWAVQYFPKGDYSEEYCFGDSLFLCLKSKDEEITAELTLELLNNGRNVIKFHYPVKVCFTSSQRRWGFVKNNLLDLYRLNGILSISYGISVHTEHRAIKNYPGGLSEHIEKLKENEESFDVTFEVEGENISAHRLMLAARSPVFQAKLFGPMAESKMKHIKLNEMKAMVFKALLHFVYTDQLALDEQSDDGTVSIELLQDLFAAADRYALDKLILLCEEQLVKNLSVDTVVTTLHLADRHSRKELKTKCLEFASAPKNFSQVALTEKYLHIMAGSPKLFAELSKKVKISGYFAKKRRTG